MKHVLACIILFLAALLVGSERSHAAERHGRVTFSLDIAAPPQAQKVKLWFPYPTSDTHQTISNLQFNGNYTYCTLAREPQSGALYLYAEWTGPFPKRTLEVTFDASAQEHKIASLRETKQPFPVEARKYLASDFWIPASDKKISALAKQITAGKPGTLAKARAIYEWVVQNTRRDPDVPGCGLGDVQATLSSRSGKCADLSSVFVALARAAGVPSREVFGLRLGRPGQKDITGGHHCWAEFYLPGSGWVPVDPADVRKLMFEKKLDLKSAKQHVDYYFGGVDKYRITLHKGGRGLSFAEGNAKKVNYFMYPYAEVDGKPLDYCQPKTFSYSITFRE